jgi:PPOX class probable F420-dependent enzyme
MPSRRDAISMTPDEMDEFLHGRHVMNVATLGPTGHPHLVAMWYGFLDGSPAFWTYGQSQKILNLRRDPRLTVLVEDGDVYEELQGVELVGTGQVLDDPDQILAIGLDVARRYVGPEADSDAGRAFVEKRARKRLGVVVHIEHAVSWDHRKLGGVY